MGRRSRLHPLSLQEARFVLVGHGILRIVPERQRRLRGRQTKRRRERTVRKGRLLRPSLSALQGVTIMSSISSHDFPAQQPPTGAARPKTQFSIATKEIGYVKGSLYGPPGDRKSTVMAMLLLYLSKTYHNCAPVAWLASEKGVDFVLDFFKAEGVPLLVSRSRSFVDLRSATRDARESGCCAVGVDSITHFWQELFTSGMQAKGPRLQKIMRIKEEWAPFSQDFQDSPLHFLVTGRLGFNWDEAEVQNEQTGEITKEVSRGGTKIKAEGDFGHEPDLEIEMSAVEDPDFMRWEKVRGKNRKTFKSQMIHVATLKKSRVWES